MPTFSPLTGPLASSITGAGSSPGTIISPFGPGATIPATTSGANGAPYKLEGIFNLSLSIDNQTYDFGSNGLDYIKILESVTAYVPVIEIKVSDNYYKTDIFPVHDASQINISLESLKYENQTLFTNTPFRLWSAEILPESHSDYLKIIGYYDAVAFLKTAVYKYIKGNSSDVATQLGSGGGGGGINSTGGLQGSIADASNDGMTWINPGIPASKWMSRVALGAYADPNSAFSHAVTREGILRFYNINQRKTNTPDWIFTEVDDEAYATQENEVAIISNKYNLDSGIMNTLRGYGVFSGVNSVKSTTGVPNPINIPSLNKSTTYSEINKNAYGPMRYDDLPYNVGNVHDFMEQAKNQNSFYLSLYSVIVTCVTTRPKNVQLLDLVRLVAKKGNTGQLRTATVGTYYVDKIMHMIYRNTLVVMYVLIRDGTMAGQAIGDLF